MLKIQVLGKGLIPRGYGLAPRLNPFPADLILIGTILDTYGLSVNYLNPDDNAMHPLTKNNLKKIYNKYGMGNNNITVPPTQNTTVESKEEVPSGIPTPPAPVPPVTPVTPTIPPVTSNPEEKVVEKSEEKVEEKAAAPTTTDEKKEENNSGTLKPINAPDNNNQNQNQNNQNNQNKQQQFNKNGNNNNNNNKK